MTKTLPEINLKPAREVAHEVLIEDFDNALENKIIQDRRDTIMAIIDMAEDMQVQEWKRKDRNEGATSIGYARIIERLKATLSPKE